MRTKALRGKTFKEGIKAQCQASKHWNKGELLKRESVVAPDLTIGAIVPNIQDEEEKPVFIGGDVVALYPSMDPIGTAEMIFQAVRESDVTFDNIDYKWLMIYLYVILGEEGLKEYNLDKFIPKRKAIRVRGKLTVSKARSLAAKSNRSLENWIINLEDMSEEDGKQMVAVMMKINLLVLMDSTCYTFGGDIMKQIHGAGIGLRASACAVKVVMGLMDIWWAKIQLTWRLSVQIILRFIDDL